MSQDQLSDDAEAAIKAAYLLIGDKKLQAELRDEQRAKAALERLRLPTNARGGLLHIVNKLAAQQSLSAENLNEQRSDKNESTEIERILLESFTHIRWSFWISIIMSVVLFLVGVLFLGTVLVQSLRTADVSTSTLTIAGVGIADLVVLFYSRPWKDVATNLANSQQIRMIATSYLAAFPLVRSGRPEQMKALADLTDRSVHLIRESLKETPPGGESN